MKKSIMFLFCAIVVTSAFAQKNRYDGDGGNTGNNSYWAKEKDYQNDRDRDKRNFSIAKRNMEIQRVSSRYDYQIQQVSRDRSLNRRERKYAIKALQSQKAQQINRIYLEYNRDVYTYNRKDGYNDNNRHKR